MPLPSQTVRPQGNAISTMSRGRGPKLKPIAIGAGAVLLVAGAIWALTRIGGGEEAPMGPKAATAASPATPTRAPVAGLRNGTETNAGAPGAATPNVAAKPPEPPPFELRQGRQRPAPSETAAPAPGVIGNPAPAVAIGPGTTNPTAAPPSATPQAVTPAPAAGIGAGVAADLQGFLSTGFQKLSAGDPVGAREALSRALLDDRLPENDKAAVRAELTRINDDIVFSPRIAQGDPYCFAYTVAPGDSLVRINQRNNLGPDWRLIKRINRMASENRLGLNQRLKLIRGPFHGVVHKSAYRLDIWMGSGPDPTQWVYIRSFSVGLGESGSTPTGDFSVKKGSKLIDPPWVNPRTGERFAGGAADNPIGRHWVGLEGLGEASMSVGYGLHGTIDPESIGQQKSMGCIRMHAEDIALVYELMGEQVSTVRILP